MKPVIRNEQLALFLVGVLVASRVASAQTLYRCGSTYSQTPCSSDATLLRVGPDTASKSADASFSKALADAKLKPPPSPEFVRGRLQECERKIKSLMKDPEAARISDGSRMGPDLQYLKGVGAYNGTSYTFKVNGKNSYGGYTGNKLWTCVYDLTETKFITANEVGGYPD